MSDVVVAWDAPLEREVVVKLLAVERCRDAVSRRRFVREAAAAARLAPHPYALGVLDSGEWRGRPYLVLEYLPGGSVADRLAVGPAPPRALALRWLAQAADALDEAHARGLVHRDVKPANLLLDERDDIRVADFGIAHDAEETGLTLTGEILGTAGYLAPEQARGEPASAASDRYALAVVARELLGDVPARALATDPAERYPTAAALVAALGADEDPTRVLVARGRAIARIPRTREAAPIGRPQPRRVRRSVSVLAVAVVAAAAAAGGAFVAGRASATGATPAAATRTQLRQTCALSTVGHNANVVVSGVGALRFCRLQAHTLELQGVEWTYRAGKELFVPDTGSGSLQRVCVLGRGSSRLRVYDSGAQTIGSDVCRWYAAGGWQEA
jgi:serine/threonine-protein kinase